MKPGLLRFPRALAVFLFTLVCADGAPRGKAGPILIVDFEKTRGGEIPRGFTKEGKVEVTDETAHTGKKCLMLHPAQKGARRIVKTGDEVTKLGDQQWGRLYLKVKLPTPVPVIPVGQNFGVIHSTLVEGSATSPLHEDPIWVRLFDTCTGPGGTLQYLYDVQPWKRGEFGNGNDYDHKFSDEWTLVEWHVDHAKQTYRLCIDGEEIEGTTVENGKERIGNKFLEK